MPTIWFAQKSGNISANDVFFDAPSGGNAKDVSTQSDNTIILCANSYTIALDEDVTGLRLSTVDEDGGGAGVAGGGFTVSGTTARVVNANLSAGTTTCLTASHTGTGANGLTINGRVIGGSSSNAYGLNNTSTGTFTINVVSGDAITGGSTGSGRGVYNTSTGIGNVVGNISASSSAPGLYNASTGALNITGDCTGNGSTAVYLAAAATTVTVTGSVIAGSASNAFGINNATNATLTINSGNLIYSTYAPAVLGPFNYNPGTSNYIQMPKTTGGAGNYKFGMTILAAAIINGISGQGTSLPATGTYVEAAASDVKSGVGFGPGSSYTGTYSGGGGPLIGLGGLIS